MKDARRLTWVLVLFACLTDPRVVRCSDKDAAWGWAQEHVDECRDAILGNVASWRLAYSSDPGIPMRLAVRASAPHDFLDVALLVALKERRLTRWELKVADRIPIFDQLVRIRMGSPKASSEEICNGVRVREVRLDTESLRELEAQLLAFTDLTIRMPPSNWDSWVVHAGGLQVCVFAKDIDEYAFNLNMPPIEPHMPNAADGALEKWVYSLLEWVNQHVALHPTDPCPPTDQPRGQLLVSTGTED